MAVDPSVRIDIAAEFTGKKAFDKADKSTAKLTKSVKSLAKGFLGVFAIQKLVSYSKASVKAFAADDAAAKSLGMTLKNLGLAYGANVGTVNGFINRLEAQTGVLDDELRPAMDRLLRATGDVTKSQELLALALDISAGTGKSVTQVSQSLQKAYLGQTAALGRLGVGLTKAELATGDFETIQLKLNALFAGQAATAADTYQGSLNKLTVASNNAKETIGKGFVDALNILSGSSTVDPVVSGIDKIANSIANTIKEVAKFKAITKDIFTDFGFFLTEEDKNRRLRIKQGTGFTTPMTISSQDTQKAALAAKKIADAKIKADKDAAAKKALADKLAAAKKKKADELAAANLAKLSKAAALFDLDRIQIEAALKGKISAEEKTRLLLMQAILEEDATTAENLAKKLAEIQKINFQIAADLAIISLTKDPFTTWAGSLSLALIKLGEYNKTLANVPNLVPGINFNPNQNRDRNYDDKVKAVTAAIELLAEPPVIAPTTNIPTPITTTNNPLPSNDLYGFSLPDYLKNIMSNPTGASTAPTPAPAAAPITIIVEGSVLDGDDFNEKVNNALLGNIRRGYSQFPAGAIATP